MKNKLNYGIIGLGRFGTALAYSLARMGAEILVVDKDEAKVSQLREITENAFIASALEKKALEGMGIQNCDVVIVCIAEAIDDRRQIHTKQSEVNRIHNFIADQRKLKQKDQNAQQQDRNRTDRFFCCYLYICSMNGPYRLVPVSAQLFYIAAYAVYLVRNLYVLRAVLDAFSASDASVSLS